MGPKLTTIASCVVVGLGMTVTTPVGSAGTYLGTRASNTPRNQQPVRDAQWQARQERQERRIQALRSAQRASAANPMVGPPARPAATIAVTNCDDAGPGSLRQAMLDAVPDDVIDLTGLTCSTITLTSGQLTSSGNLELQGPGRDQLTIDGDSNDRVLTHEYGVLEISGITIANGRANEGWGGCISVLDGSIALVDSSVTGCVAGDGSNAYAYGGGVLAIGQDDVGNVSLMNSIVTGASASSAAEVYEYYGVYYIYGRSRGGGIYASGYVYAMYGSQVTDNTATANGGTDARGGGIFSRQGVVAFVGSEISGNQVRALGESSSGDHGTAYGGGFHSNGSLNVVLQSSISGNTAYSEEGWSYGGGIHVGDDFGDFSGDLMLVAANISGNTTRADCGYCLIQGGGAHVFGVINAKYSTINDNAVLSAADSGGVACGGGLAVSNPYSSSEYAEMTLLNSTISGNRAIGGTEGAYAWGCGGGAVVSGGMFSIVNSTVTMNLASHAAGGVSVDTPDSYYGGPTFENVLISSIVASNEAPAGADIGLSSLDPVVVMGSHNLVNVAGGGLTLPSDTLNADPQLLPLAMNGGLTATHALAVGSPAIDAGSNPEAVSNDQRAGLFVREWGGAADIGAFELQPDPIAIFKDGFED